MMTQDIFAHPSFASCWAHLDHVLDVVEDRLGDQARARVHQAVDVMLLCHVGQRGRADGRPYLEHTAEVARNVVDWVSPTDENLVKAALLHDSVEDQAAILCAIGGHSPASREGALHTLRGLFGQRVAEVVSHLTNPEWPESSSRAEKNALYLRHFEDLAQKDQGAFAVKLGDFWTNALRLHTVKDPGVRGRLQAKYLPVMRFLAQRLHTAAPATLATKKAQLIDELDAVLAALDASEKD